MDKNIKAELEKTIALITAERDYDRKQFLEKIGQESYTARRKDGICWYPVIIAQTKFDGAERLRIHVERHKEHSVRHQFQSGKPVQLFANGHEDDAINGVINFVKEDVMAISLNIDEEPDWFSSGKIGVQLLFDENSYKQMEISMKQVLEPEHPRLLELIEIILGKKDAKFSVPEPYSAPILNQSQNSALQKVSCANDIAIIHGPPGTGKTTTLVQSVLHTLKHEAQVLVCAPSNTAVDLLVERLSKKGADVLRIGHSARLTEDILEHSFDLKSAQHNYAKELKEIRKRSEEYRKLAMKYKRNFGPEERRQRRELFSEARKLNSEAEQLSFYIANDIISKAQVIACTLVGAAHPLLKGKRYGSVFIDEAAQALEPACWIPVTKAQRVIFAGDHKQLPPTVKSVAAAKEGLATTLFEKAIDHNKADTLLQEQYRMNDVIMQFSNNQLYDGKLISNASVAQWTVFKGDIPVEFIDTAGCGFFDSMDEETKSYSNRDEGQIVFEHILEFVQKLEGAGGGNYQTVGIIAPYRSQVQCLQEIFDETEIAGKDKLLVNTIDSFQGQECDIMYISLTRSNEKGEIGFLSDIRRMNVAITRAKKKLVVVGDSATVGKHQFYDAFISHATEFGGYRSAYEFMWQG